MVLPEPLSPTIPRFSPARSSRIGEPSGTAARRARRRGEGRSSSSTAAKRVRVYSCCGRSKIAKTSPRSTSRPCRITAISSEISATTRMSWVMNSTAMPCSRCSRRIRSRISAWVVTSSAVGRLVGDQHRGVAGERHGDHRPLPHPARIFERVAVDRPLRVRDLDPTQELHGAGARLLAGDRLVQPNGLADLITDPMHRRERAHRFLEDDRHAAPAHGPDRGPARVQGGEVRSSPPRGRPWPSGGGAAGSGRR